MSFGALHLIRVLLIRFLISIGLAVGGMLVFRFITILLSRIVIALVGCWYLGVGVGAAGLVVPTFWA